MTLYSRDEGAGPPLVLIHGLGASGRVFDPLFLVRGKQRLISMDLPRTARSTHWAASTPDAVAAGLIDFLDSRQVGQFELFGHSFGGLVAMQMAVTVPNRVTRLSVASAPALDAGRGLRLLVHNPLADVTMGWFGKVPVLRPVLRRYLQLIWGNFAQPSQLHLDLYQEALGAPGFGEGMLEALRAVSHYRAPVSQLAAASFEKQVIWGEKDRLVSVVQGEQLAHALGAKLTVLRDVGHCLPEEHPQGLGELILSKSGGPRGEVQV